MIGESERGKRSTMAGGLASKGAGLIKKPAFRIQATDVQTAALWGVAAGATAIWVVQDSPASCGAANAFAKYNLQREVMMLSRVNHENIIKGEAICLVSAAFDPSLKCSLDAEGFAILRGLQLAKDQNFMEVQLLSDSVEAVDLVKSGRMLSSYRAPSIVASRDLVIENPSWEIIHVLREEKWQADKLARKTRVDKWNWSSLDAIPIICQRPEPLGSVSLQSF